MQRQLSSPLPTVALCRSPVPGRNNSDGYLMLNEEILVLMYSNLLPDCVYDCPTFLCGSVGVHF